MYSLDWIVALDFDFQLITNVCVIHDDNKSLNLLQIVFTTPCKT